MKKLCLLSLLLVGLTTASLSAAVLPLASWDLYIHGLAPSAITTPGDGYQLTLPGPGLLRVVDCCIIGDRLDVYIDSFLAFTTSAVNPLDDGVQSGALDGDSAWADARLSRGSIALGPGIYQIDINVIANALGTQYGGGFIRADRTDGAIPEPATMALCGAGLLGLLFARRRK